MAMEERIMQLFCRARSWHNKMFLTWHLINRALDSLLQSWEKLVLPKE
jgi:hypothetical protein